MKSIFNRTLTWICIIATLLFGVGHSSSFAFQQQMDCFQQKVSICEQEENCCCNEKPKHQDCCTSETDQDVSDTAVTIHKSVSQVFKAELYHEACSCGLLTNSNFPVSHSRQNEIVKQENIKERQIGNLQFLQKHLNETHCKIYLPYSLQKIVQSHSLVAENICLRI